MPGHSFIYDPEKKEFRAPTHEEINAEGGGAPPSVDRPGALVTPWADHRRKRTSPHVRANNNVAVFWILAIALAVTWVLIAWIARIHQPVEESEDQLPPAPGQLISEDPLPPAQ